MNHPSTSILVIGSPQSFKGTIYGLLLNGFRVLYAPKAPQTICREVFEQVTLILLDAQVSQTFEVETLSTPIVIVSGNGFGDILDAYFLQGPQVPSPETVEVQREVDWLLNNINELKSVSTRRIRVERLGGFTVLQLTSNHATQNEGVRRALNFMEERYLEDISLKDIARAACLSPYHFCRLFKKEMGITCISYLSRLRIEKAKSLLGNTPYPVTQICFEVGFNDLSHFERVFRSIEGIPPSAYRKQNHLQRQEIQA